MSVISLRQAWFEQEKFDQEREAQERIAAAHRAANAALARTIESAGEYAVEVKPADVETLRAGLLPLGEDAGRAASPEDYTALHASFRGELRAYRDKTARELARMHADMDAAATAIESLAEAVAASGAGYEQRVHQELAHLDQAAQGGDFDALRNAVSHATQYIRESCDQMLKANALTIAQLRDEIRSLHQEVERERRAQVVDRVTGGWNRLKVDTKIKDLIRLNQPFCVFLAGLSHLESDGIEPPQAWREEVIRAMLTRLESIAGEDALIGRWSEDVFAVIIDVPKEALPVTADRVRLQVSGVYVMQDNGAAHELRLTAKVALVERLRGVAEAEVYPRIGQAAFAVIAV